MTFPDDVDPDLWIRIESHGEHQDYLFANCHTHIGRMKAYCPEGENDVCVSLYEIRQASVGAGYWIKGFLHGNTPPRPFEGEVELETREEFAERERIWEERRAAFLETGRWPPPPIDGEVALRGDYSDDGRLHVDRSFVYRVDPSTGEVSIEKQDPAP